MDRTGRSLVWIWLATTAVVAAVGVYAYHAATRVPDLAGRVDPEAIWIEPTVLFTEPGILGTAIEVQVTEAVRACMADRGQTFRGPAAAEDIYSILDPATDGYGIAAGGDTPRPTLGGSAPAPADWSDYETALYGAPLDGDGSGGCADVGYQALIAAVATLDSMPYSIDQLEADAQADPIYVAALEEWRRCMADRGHTVTTPDALLVAQMEALRSAAGDAGRALAEDEKQLATDDFACRDRTLDPATEQVAERLAPEFVEANRPQLETLIPPPGRSGPDLPSGLGSGDVQVTIVWQSKADIDLYVTDPSGEQIYYSHRTSASGGALDRDANYPCGSDDSSPAAENVFWPAGGAPGGTYHVTVHYTNDCFGEGAAVVNLIVQVQGRVVHQDSHRLDGPGSNYDFEFRAGS